MRRLVRRFGVFSKFELYTPEEIGHIIRRSANILEIEIDEQSVDEISKRARGTPRVANRILKRVRDFAQVMGAGHITLKDTVNAMEMLSINSRGVAVAASGSLFPTPSNSGASRRR